ncbi:hypothetical protein MSAN_01410400 [Mycena sanguinolenta]|uniref:Nucleolar protein 9 n=1 Tax=Mycena sanguinolenta TaxID=230812 RepID=A0A8H6Y824_9AGAR|nr:hypothetical protein MSAN_01410400 [Mycena sanguinolenta]
MPKEHRKRGKKKKPEPEWQPPVQDPLPAHPVSEESPSWIVPARKDFAEEDVNPEAPFGYVDGDVKAYFRTVDVQMKSWQNPNLEASNDEDTDPNEERRMFFVAALTEMSDKEKQLATDPECSLVLERMTHSMDDFARRVFMDRLIGSYDVLVKHRFASHVCQTLFTVASQTVSREKRGILPAIPETSEKGELRTLTQLILDMCEELFPVFASLIMHPFASHVIRALLVLLSPNLVASHETAQHAMRSKKSAAWKAKQGPLNSVFEDGDNKRDFGSYIPPEEFSKTARRFVEVVRQELDANETRALAADKVASPTLQMLLAVEADQRMAEDSDSLMDRVLVGLISSSRDDPSEASPVSDYLITLLRDPTSSHLLETIVSRCPGPAFSILWTTYFKGNLPRIASHPVANFVLAKALERVSVTQLTEACEELQNVWTKLIQTSRTGVLRAIIDRAAILKACGSEVTEAVSAGFQTQTSEERHLLVPCMLRLQTFQPRPNPLQGEGKPTSKDEPKVQGAVLLQSLLRLPEPHYRLVTESLNSLSEEDMLVIAHHATSSRVLDALLESPMVPQKVKRQFVLSFIGRYHLLVDDRIGSRVGDRCWAFSDTYLKVRITTLTLILQVLIVRRLFQEKIARSLIPQEQFLAGSYYGKFFARNLNLYLLQRRPEEWRTMQTARNRPVEQPAKQPTVAVPPVESVEEASSKKEPKKRKRNAGGDEIDELFATAIGKKVKRAALVEQVSPSGKAAPLDNGLADVMGAIRAAPAEKGKRKR